MSKAPTMKALLHDMRDEINFDRKIIVCFIEALCLLSAL